MSFEKNDVEFTFIWTIENFNRSMHQPGEPLDSPYFPAVDETGNPDETQWYLRVYPRGFATTSANIACYLIRRNISGPETVTIGYEMSFLGSVGSITKSPTEGQFTFKQNSYSGFVVFAKRNEVLEYRRSEFLPHNTLTIRCRMWKINPKQPEDIIETRPDPGMCHAHTRINVESRVFTWNIQNFDTLPAGHKQNLRLQPVTKQISPLDFSLKIGGEGDDDEKIDIEISQNNIYSRTLLVCCATAVQANGGAIASAEEEHVFEKMTTLQTWKFPSFLTKQQMMSSKNKNGVFSIRCECFISNGKLVSDMQSIIYGPLSYIESNLSKFNLSQLIGEDCFFNASTLRNDLGYLYNEEIFCDVNIQTECQVFPAHKSILSARSPVFRAMFAGDMVEKTSNVVTVLDMEADTMRRLLLYIYTDTVEHLQWDSAGKLLSAADRYSVLPLVEICSTILKSSICKINAGEILALADLHEDKNLKRTVQEFILSQKSDFFNTEEWKNFMQSDLELAAETMHLKITRKH